MKLLEHSFYNYLKKIEDQPLYQIFALIALTFRREGAFFNLSNNCLFWFFTFFNFIPLFSFISFLSARRKVGMQLEALVLRVLDRLARLPLRLTVAALYSCRCCGLLLLLALLAGLRPPVQSVPPLLCASALLSFCAIWQMLTAQMPRSDDLAKGSRWHYLRRLVWARVTERP